MVLAGAEWQPHGSSSTYDSPKARDHGDMSSCIGFAEAQSLMIRVHTVISSTLSIDSADAVGRDEESEDGSL